MYQRPLASTALKELHKDLARKYGEHGAKITEIWQHLDPSQRAKALKASTIDGSVLENPNDRSLRDVYKSVPELNLRDISKDPSFLLRLLDHRATTTLYHQFESGPNKENGDYHRIITAMETQGLQHPHAAACKDCYTWFESEEKYGDCIRVGQNSEQFHVLMKAQLALASLVPATIGELVLHRVQYTLMVLVALIDNVLKASPGQGKKKRPKKSTKGVTQAFSGMQFAKQPQPLSIPNLDRFVAAAYESKDAHHELLSLIREEPVVLTHLVNVAFLTRPELVADEKGRRLPTRTRQQHKSAAVMDAVVSVIVDAAIWDYIFGLLTFLSGANGKAYGTIWLPIILQELSSVFNLKFARSQVNLKRCLATGSCIKWLKRMSTATVFGNAKLATKIQPEQLKGVDLQLKYLLHLCEPNLTAKQAMDWVQKLDTLHRAHPLEQEKLGRYEMSALAQLGMISILMHNIWSTVPIPTTSRKKGQLFVSRLDDIEAKLGQSIHTIDLDQSVNPIDNLLNPEVAAKALKTLDAFVLETAGSRLGHMCCDMLHRSLNDLEDQLLLEIHKSKILVASDSEIAEATQLEQFEEIEPTDSTAFDIYRPDTRKTTQSMLLPSTVERVHKVMPVTVKVFSALLDPSNSGASITWADVHAALVDLAFYIEPGFGPVYIVWPPAGTDDKLLTLHGPRHFKLESSDLIIFRTRFENTYFTWTSNTFIAG